MFYIHILYIYIYINDVDDHDTFIYESMVLMVYYNDYNDVDDFDGVYVEINIYNYIMYVCMYVYIHKHHQPSKSSTS